MSIQNLLELHPQEFVNYLKLRQIRRFFFVYDAKSGRVHPSDKHLQSIADFIQADQRDFLQHEGLFFQITREHDTLQGAFVHRTIRGQSAGGVRFWQYDTMEEYL
ncbi:hypothetical protein GWO43_29680, partial [candidate division KSB1 bacterium]|nr:hypothetical protein [candidate division KSB1 bacterium]NIR72044.1 hypothetical protein [candidate division KSB1 bacterium]NIS25985.1 hypothetical protein [candidate division KSB1 bacterium]NIT74956.1 hypothetical protein [candidate division KSB1 bacterium]NIU28740.1 hypothetical protein [candidate division KSB1 bacterium]